MRVEAKTTPCNGTSQAPLTISYPERTDRENKIYIDPEIEFKQAKKKYTKAVAILGGSLSLVSILGAFKKGPQFPSRLLQVLGDAFGSVAGISAPFMQAINELKNFRSEKNGNSKLEFFDDYLKLFYRFCSQGLTPFIFERLINPENITKSIFHKIAAVINIPFTAFTGYTWGFGNTQAIIAWSLRKREETLANISNNENELHRLRAESYNKIYSSAERMLTIGSIANPVMPCLQYGADGIDYLVRLFKGEATFKELFERPLLSASKLVSTAIALPEAYAKGIDAIVRVFVNERKHLRAVLPDSLSNHIENFCKKLEEKLSTNENTLLKRTKNTAEMIFHTLSPFAMAALFSPMIDRKATSEEAQNRGGITALLDKCLGVYAKSLATVFTGFYVVFGRLPQGILQSIYFARKLYGHYIKHEDENTTHNALDSIRKNIYNNVAVTTVSNFARNITKKLVPNFYDVEHDYGFPNYKQVLAKYSFDQAKEDYKILFDILNTFSIDNEALRKAEKDRILSALPENTNVRYGGEIDLSREEIIQKIVEYCLNYAKNDCIQGNYNLSNEELQEISKLIRKKITQITTPYNQREKQNLTPSFPGALFLARIFSATLDIQSRLVDWGHDKLVKLEAYERDEKNRAFNNELEVVCAENADCLRRFLNFIQGIPAHA